MYRHYKHKRHLTLFLFHKEGAAMQDSSEDLVGIHNWNYLADVASCSRHLLGPSGLFGSLN